jgi:hypothetical protein
MSKQAWSGVVCASLLACFGGDSGGGGDGAPAAGAFCSALSARLRACDLLTQGELACVEPEPGFDTCTARCAVGAECDDLEFLVCAESIDALSSLETSAPALAQCLGDCRGFTCEDGSESIPETWVCDFQRDCGDGSDEADCADAGFGCADGQRIPLDFRCDQAVDCADGSDELSCEDTMFTCGDGTSVPAHWECDFEADCEDGSDEAACNAQTFECEDGERVPDYLRCDGEDDCPDASDEAGCADFVCD